MGPNLNGIDRIVRIFLGLAIIWGAAVTFSSAALWISVLIGLGLTLSGAFGFCPAYNLMGFRTNEQ
jgi:hypothetical protein